ncbi:MAG: MipA/OmpV family protein [Hyphomicrobiales bacterium]|nr:MipA/OmpV family protein [Hyphomicrobiales bacterium]MDE2286076.1 MipA/OmpV family protein [Hyphomicrobiales bacterium]
MDFRKGRLLVVAMAFVTPAAAADLDQSAAPAPMMAKAPAAVSDWLVTIGGEVRALPAWPGAPSTVYSIGGFPLFNIGKPGDPPVLFAARDGFGVPLLDFGKFQVGPVGTLSWPRYVNPWGSLHGLNNVDWAVQLGGYAQYWPVPWLRVRAEARQGIGGETGQSGDVYVDAVVPVGQFRVSGGPRLSLQSAAATSPYFSITPAQAATAGLPAYNAGGGVYSYGAGGQLEYFFNERWQVHGIFEYERLDGSAANSPLVTMRGSPNQYTFGVGGTYTFTMHPLW